MWTTEMKMLLSRVLFGDKIYYTKKEGYQTPHLSALYRIVSTIQGDKVSSGAVSPKEFEHIYQTIVSIPIRQVRELFRVYCKYFRNQEDITKTLSPKQLILYGFKEEC